MKREIETRQQLIERLNNIDRKCIDEGLHFHDLKTLYESKEYKLSSRDKADIKKVAAIEDDPETLKAYIDSKAIEEDIDWDPEDYAGGYTEWDLIDSKKVPNRGRKKTEYNLWYNEFEDRWVCTVGDSNIYYPENVAEYEAEFEDEEEARKWFEDYLTEEHNNLGESVLTDDEYDYFAVYKGEILQGEYPTYAEAKKNAGEGCVVKGVTQYGGNEFEETEIEESFNEEEPGFNDYLLQNYGITSDDLSDEDYDRAWNEFEQHISKEKNIKEDLAEENIHYEEVCNLEIDIDVSGLWGSDGYDEDRIWENLGKGDIIRNLEKFIAENTPEGVKFDIMDYDSERKSMTAYLYIGLEEELDDSDIETLVFNIIKNWDYQERTYYEYSKGSSIRPQEFEISADVYAYAEVGKIYPYSEYR